MKSFCFRALTAFCILLLCSPHNIFAFSLRSKFTKALNPVTDQVVMVPRSELAAFKRLNRVVSGKFKKRVHASAYTQDQRWLTEMADQTFALPKLKLDTVHAADEFFLMKHGNQHHVVRGQLDAAGQRMERVSMVASGGLVGEKRWMPSSWWPFRQKQTRVVDSIWKSGEEAYSLANLNAVYHLRQGTPIELIRLPKEMTSSLQQSIESTHRKLVNMPSAPRQNVHKNANTVIEEYLRGAFATSGKSEAEARTLARHLTQETPQKHLRKGLFDDEVMKRTTPLSIVETTHPVTTEKVTVFRRSVKDYYRLLNATYPNFSKRMKPQGYVKDQRRVFEAVEETFGRSPAKLDAPHPNDFFFLSSRGEHGDLMLGQLSKDGTRVERISMVASGGPLGNIPGALQYLVRPSRHSVKNLVTAISGLPGPMRILDFGQPIPRIADGVWKHGQLPYNVINAKAVHLTRKNAARIVPLPKEMVPYLKASVAETHGVLKHMYRTPPYHLGKHSSTVLEEYLIGGFKRAGVPEKEAIRRTRILTKDIFPTKRDTLFKGEKGIEKARLRYEYAAAVGGQ